MTLLPPMSAKQLRALAEKRGVLPPSSPRKARSDATAPTLRPWHPYRSKWEAEYARHLDVQRRAGVIESWDYEPDRLEIGIGAKYTPDFRIKRDGGFVEYHEVKGYKRPAAMVRLRAAAKQYPQHAFVLVTRTGAGWHLTVIGSPQAPTGRSGRGGGE